MSTNHKPKKARKSKKGTKKGSSRGKKGLSGTSTAAKAMSMKQAFVETGKQGGGTALGLLGSAVIGWGLDKIPFLKPNEADGKMVAILKKATKPVAILGIGATASVVGRKKGWKFVASVGDGTIAGGAYSGVKALFGSKTEIFNGLGADEETLSKVANYYQENLKELSNVLKENGQVVELKGLNSPEEDVTFGEAPIIPGTQINYNNASSLI